MEMILRRTISALVLQSLWSQSREYNLYRQ